MSDDGRLTVDVNGLKFHYPDRQPVLNISKFQLLAKQTLFLQGSSGSGKSTLLNILCGTLVASSGEVHVLGRNITKMSSSQRDQFRANQIGVVFQQFNLIPYLNVVENIQLGGYFSEKPAERDSDIFQLLEQLSLPKSVAMKRADQLSIGQQQRVAIARALINRPCLLIADEPTSALDADATEQFVETLLEVCKESGCALIFVSHDDGLARHFDLTAHMQSINEIADAN